MIQEATGVILAGGRSRRFGSPKALAPWNDKCLVEAVLEILNPLFPSILALVKKPEDYSFLETPRVKVMSDLFEEVHPLGGIYSALEHAGSEWIFVCGCDMPFVRPELIQALWRARSGCQAVVPVWEGKRQPLCAFYSQAAKNEIGRAIERKDFAVRAVLDSLPVHFLDEDSVRVTDPEGRTFNDIDTQEDYERARKL
ncbi:MAG: hypothetical protein A2901_00790 [Elusimicrobia bacterium RIFCSPLOWO2_01_FULL_54_10]|nr:MAG: hypothetical protein A2901_00790 [Elusimicrobia bacterium RIFCSPLOWO2_01_FULL_54_10]